MSVLVSETGHVFCCVLPVLFSVLSLFASLGVLGTVPNGILQFHDIMHRWEVPVIVFSALTLILGWGLNSYSKKLTCNGHDCAQNHCGTPKNSKTDVILIIASVLFAVNLCIYLFVHPSDPHLALDIHQH